MAKRKSWFGWIKRLFICEAKVKPEKRPRRLKWVFRRLKLRQQIAQETKTLNEATEDQRKHAMNVAIATAAAAEAAVAAAKAAAEVVRMAGDAFTSQHFDVKKRADPNSAAIKIQSAFRAYLARKALRALKALVRIQAIVRGRAVRRKVSPLLKYNKASTSNLIQRNIERKHWSKTKEEFKALKHSKIEFNDQNGWDNSALTKEDIKAIWLKKQEGVIKRERMLKYSRSHRERRSPHMFMEPLYTKDIGMRSCRLEHWGGESTKSTKVKLRNLQRQEDSGDGQDSPFSFPRRSFSRLEQSLMEDESWFQRSNGFLQPYMSVTESAKQKFRSLSTPRRQSITGLTDSWFDINEKKDGDKVSLWSSFVSETNKISSLNKSSLSTTNQHYVKS